MNEKSAHNDMPNLSESTVNTRSSSSNIKQCEKPKIGEHFVYYPLVIVCLVLRGKDDTLVEHRMMCVFFVRGWALLEYLCAYLSLHYGRSGFSFLEMCAITGG